ncbi:hypothetical protein BJX99DRAFT_258333 [Aspergillus californicus]
MRSSLLFFVPALVAGLSQPPASSTTSVSPPNPTICGNFTVVNATQAYDCLRSVPFDSAVGSQLLQYINDTIQFHSTLAYLANPPPHYQQPAVDLIAELRQVQRDIDNGVFQNEYDFEISISRVLNAAHDDHLSFTGGILSTFVFGSPYDIVSISSDGIELPKLYIVDSLTSDGGDSLSYQPSAIAAINDQDVIEYLTEFAARHSIGKLEPHADWNMLMQSGALDTQGLLEVFFGGVTSYPGDTIKFTLENGSVIGPERWQAVYRGPPNTGPLQTGGDFYNFFVLGLFPASYEESTTESTPLPPAPSASSSSTGAWWDEAYPTPEPALQGVPDDAGLPRMFFLNDSSIAVLSITGFSAYGDAVSQFVDTVKAFLTRSKEAGLKKVVIDVQQNRGGQPLLAIEVFRMFFPSLDPFAGSHRRAHPFADALGDIITPYWKNLTRNSSDYYYLSTNEWVIANRLNPQTEEKYTSWDEYFLSTTTYDGDNFTNVEQYDLSNTLFTEEAAGFAIDNLDKSGSPPYAARDIAILSDGLCSSACAVFMELMHHQGQVQTIAVGGRPDYTPMQAPSGSRGAGVYDVYHMDLDIRGALAIDNSSARSALPLSRRNSFSINYASINLRDQIRHDDPLKMPLQFHNEAADCRIFFTPSTWHNYSNLWKYAADAIWHNQTLCIANSTTNSTQLDSPPAPYRVQKTESNSKSQHPPVDEEDTSHSRHIDDPTNNILAVSYEIGSMNGSPCKSDCECGSMYACTNVRVCQNGKTKTKKQCAAHCSILTGNSQTGCPLGYHCKTYGTATRSSQHVNRRTLYRSGYCMPTSCVRDDDPTGIDSYFRVQPYDQQLSSGVDDSKRVPCKEDWGGVSMHCFSYTACLQKCYLFDEGSHRILGHTFYAKTRINKWETNQAVNWNYYSEYGIDSDMYYDPSSNTPVCIILHKDDATTWEETHSA